VAVSELVVDVRRGEIAIAVLEDRFLVELQTEKRSGGTDAGTFAVGDIFLGRVKRIMPGLNAAFVDVGYTKDAFLHYQDLGPHFNTHRALLAHIRNGGRPDAFEDGTSLLQPEINKDGHIGDILKTGQEIAVQVTKEPISTKGPRLSAELSFAGRYMVLLPFGNRLSISTKIRSSAERARLKQLTESIKVPGCTLILRTSSEGAHVSELDMEMKSLMERWQATQAKVERARPTDKIYEETGRVVALLRDIFNPSFKHIHVNDPDICREVRDYVRLIAPDRNDIVREYRGSIPLFDHFGITRQAKAAFGKIVNFKQGAYLIIERTEAMWVVDVNSGPRVRSDTETEAVALNVNIAAAEEIARQLRLRDLGGIIVVDFIDLKDTAHRQQLFDHMRAAMATDRAKHNILALSKFGLMQITRQRVRQATAVVTEETCPMCLGKGKVQRPTLLFVEDLELLVARLSREQGLKRFRLHLHPFVAAYLKSGWIPLSLKWRFRYAWGLRIIPDQQLGLLERNVFDADRNEVDLTPPADTPPDIETEETS
jgi:ribonuclease G